MGTEKQYATAQGQPHNLSPTAAERQLTALLEAMAQYFAEPSLFRTESVCRGRFEDVERNGNEENKRGKEREAAAKRAEHPALTTHAAAALRRELVGLEV